MNYCTASGLTSLGTAFGLAQVAGINAYLPLLVLSVVSRWLHMCTINSHVAFITQDWFMIGLAVLTFADFITDKIPFLASFWDLLHTIIRPVAGGLVAVATMGGSQAALQPGLIATVPGSHMVNGMLQQGFLASMSGVQIPGTVSLIFVFIVGFILAGTVHITKSGIRFSSSGMHALTAGVSNIILSVGEDGMAVIGIIVSFLLPAFMFVLVILFTLFFLFSFRWIIRGLRWRRARANRLV